MEASDAALRAGGRRLTPQRYLILRVIQEAQAHLSMEQIITLVQQRNPCVNQATVYRTVDLLQTLGLVRATHLSGKRVWYEVVDGQAHHHFICRNCHGVLHLDPDLLGALPTQLTQQYGFDGLTLELVARGYCQACWQSIQQTQSATAETTAIEAGTHSPLG